MSATIVAGVFEVPAAVLNWLYAVTNSYTLAIALVAVIVRSKLTPAPRAVPVTLALESFKPVVEVAMSLVPRLMKVWLRKAGVRTKQNRPINTHFISRRR